ncbi:MAG: SufD family Fe-S cluster assembly protein [Thaumarchaeota archaeon]|nr:SufD family Fe-S cluster assembly protein [Candidatus Calditenuaceae archaeon]MDW8186968.1 SufD family Fe-S cluster assembly protein [Nitrososphaerota archaeon]
MVKLSEEPSWLRELRARGEETYRSLPEETSQLYVKHHVPFSQEIASAEWIKEPSGRAVVPERFRALEESEEVVALHVDATPVLVKVPESYVRLGVVALPLWEALTRSEEEVRKWLLEGPTRPEESSLIGYALSTLNSGVFVKVPSGIEDEVRVRSIWATEAESQLTSAFTLVVAGDGSGVSVTEEYHAIDGGANLTSNIVHVIAGNGSKVRYAVLDSSSDRSVRMSFNKVVLGREANSKWVGALLGGRALKYRIDNILAGQGSRADALKVVLAGGNQKFDVTLNLRHEGPDTTGRVNAKGIGAERSRVLFKGIIRIERPAKNSGAYLAEHAMLLSPDSRADAIPGLEIETDNVKATHSASVAQIDPEQLFYLMSRGLTKDEAVKAIALGFFEPVIQEIDVAEVRWGMRYLLERKWHGPEAEELDPIKIIESYIEPETVGRSPEDIFGTHYKAFYYKRTR